VRFETHDAEDGYDTVEWAAKFPGSNGKVGTFGGSYNAFLQWRLAPLAMAAFTVWAEDEGRTREPSGSWNSAARATRIVLPWVPSQPGQAQ
jgi:predicted acyl esterase